MNPAIILLIGACVALNVSLGSIVYILKLPLYLDSLGIPLCALLASGSRAQVLVYSCAVALISFLVGGILINPFLPWFVATGLAGAVLSTFLIAPGLRASLDGKVPVIRILVFGVVWGVVAAVVSAPVVVYLFGGVTGSGTAFIVAFFLKAGEQLMQAALYSGLTAEPVDKSIQLLIAYALAAATPVSFRKALQV